MDNLLTIALVGVLFICDMATGDKCVSACGKNNSIEISSTKLLRCSVAYTLHTPFSRNTERTAPMPQNIMADWYITDKNWIALSVKWSQRAIDLTSGDVQGYYLKIDELWTKIKIRVAIEDITKNSKNVTSPDVVNFEYPCVGTFDNAIEPRSEITIKLHSLPMFRYSDKPQFKKAKVKIPGCEDDQRLSRVAGEYECLAYWNGYDAAAKTSIPPTPYLATNKTTIYVHQRFPDHTIYFVLAGVIAVFAIIPILLCMVSKSSSNTKGHSAITMITNGSIFDMIKAHKLVTKLREQYNLEITTNWENQELIGRDGFQWYQDTINQSTIVIFLFDTWKIRDRLQDEEIPVEIRQAMHCTGHPQITSKTEVAILTVKTQGNKNTSAVRYRVFEAKKDFHKLLKTLTGKNIPKGLTLDKLFAMERPCKHFVSSQRMSVAINDAIDENGRANSLLQDCV